MRVNILILSILSFSLYGCGNDCESREGKLVFTHFITVPVNVGGIIISQQIGQYRCVIDKK